MRNPSTRRDEKLSWCVQLAIQIIFIGSDDMLQKFLHFTLFCTPRPPIQVSHNVDTPHACMLLCPRVLVPAEWSTMLL